MEKQSTAKRLRSRRLFQVMLLSLLICLIGGGIALFAQVESGQNSHATPAADPANVVGPPTLPAATVDAIFASMGSPMVGTGKAVEQAARQANIDDAFALGVWWTETNDGAAGVGSADRNPGSVRGSAGYPAAFDGYTIYPSYTTAVYDWFNLLRSRYVNRGLTTVYAISYPYVGTSSSPLWAGKVVALMQRYHAEAPPPTPTVPSLDQVKRASHQTPQISITLLRRNHPFPRIVNGGTVDLRSQGQQTPPAANTQQSGSKSSLSQGTKYGLVLLGMLAALVLALWGLALGGTLQLPLFSKTRATTPAGVSSADIFLKTTSQMPVVSTAPLALPVTGAMLSTPRPAFVPVANTNDWRELLPPPRTDALVSTTATTSPLRTPIAPRVGLPVRGQGQEQEDHALPPTGPSTTALRRVVLRPSQTPVTVAVPARTGGGLLSRYRESMS